MFFGGKIQKTRQNSRAHRRGVPHGFCVSFLSANALKKNERHYEGERVIHIKMYYKKNNKGANTYGEARRGKGQNQSRFVVGASTASISPLEIAREEDHLEEELGYRVPGLNNGGAEGAVDAEDVQLGWLVNASAVRFSIRSIFFFFFFFFVCVVFVSAIEMRKSSPRGKIQKFSNLYRKRAD